MPSVAVNPTLTTVSALDTSRLWKVKVNFL